MSYFYSNPIAEAATMGGAAGDRLGQLMGQMPLQRAQLMMQVQQAKAEQQQQMLNYALRQREQQAQQAYQTSELDLHQQELKQNDATHQLELQRLNKMVEEAQTRSELLKKGKFKVYKDPTTGQTSLFNDTTGETKPFSPAPGMMPQRPPVPITDYQKLEALNNIARTIGAYQASGMNTNLPTVFGALTNSIPGLSGMPVPQGMPTNMVPPQAAVPQAMPQAPGTNVIKYDDFLKGF
jgi:hypothetical protein